MFYFFSRKGLLICTLSDLSFLEQLHPLLADSTTFSVKISGGIVVGSWRSISVSGPISVDLLSSVVGGWASGAGHIVVIEYTLSPISDYNENSTSSPTGRSTWVSGTSTHIICASVFFLDSEFISSRLVWPFPRWNESQVN